MKTTFWIALSFVPLLASLGLVPQRSPTAAGGIVYVSAQRIGAETAEGRAGLARVQALQRERGDEVRQKQQALEATRSQLLMAQSESRVKLQAQEQQQRGDLERAVARAQADIQAAQRQINGDVLARIRSLMVTIAPERNIQLVLNSETAVVWASPSLDLTDTVIARMNAATPDTTVK